MTDDQVVPAHAEAPPKKRRVNSKGKGNGYENSVAKLLSTKFAPLQFRRSQSSGAIVGGKNERFMTQFSREALRLFSGDVAPFNEEDVIKSHGWSFRFGIECKFYKDADDIAGLLKGERIFGWFAKALVDAAKVKCEPILIFKFNRTDAYVAVDLRTCTVPATVESSILLVRHCKDEPQLAVFKLEDALKDDAWWKINVPSA